MSEIVRGRTVHATFSYDRVELEIAAEDHAKVFLGAAVLLVPDDGTHRVVGVEEWKQMERDHRAMEKIRKERQVLMCEQRSGNWIYGQLGVKCGVTKDPADSILGSNGGESK